MPPPESDASLEAPRKVKKPRLPALDSIRFFLIAYISIGHFIALATKDIFVLKLATQVNVVVGAFFVLSGYVAGYTATELGKYEASPRIKPEIGYIISRIAGYLPLYLLAQVVFAPVFLYADVFYNGVPTALFHGLITTTLSQVGGLMHRARSNPSPRSWRLCMMGCLQGRDVRMD
eukprot:scaffold3183_cov381-Prasinococcus_capsulatus_cf.AAC.12